MPDHPSQIIVLADDLSGAAELAGIAFAHGLSAEVRRVGPAIEDRAGPPAQVLAIDTDSRHLSASAAAARVKQITEQILATTPAWLYKKVDSVLRGNVRAEVEAMLQVTGQSRALLIPANPSRGRLIQDGRYSIDGIPLDQTAFARDPEHPRVSSDVFTLLGAKTAEMSVPDVETQSQLEQFAARFDPTTLPAGAADFFSTLLSHRAPQRPRGRESLSENTLASASSPTDKDSRPLSARLTAPAILICGSPAAWPSRRQQCTAAGIPVLEIESGSQTGRTDFRNLLVGISESEPVDAHVLISLLARFTKALIENASPRTVLAEGGATAAAIAEEIHWRRFQVVASAPAGVGVLQPLAPNAPLFLIKPGSYPWPPEIWQAFCACNR